METDAEIIRRSVEEPRAFEAIFERHAGVILAYARRRVGHAAGEEVASQTFLIAFERRARFDPSFASARPWLLGIATNLLRHHVRDERLHLAALGKLGPDTAEDPVGDPDRLDAERLAPALGAALIELSEGDRETFLLVALGELTYHEAALALEIPVGTVRSRVHRARMRLREQLRGLAETPGWTDEMDPGESWTSSS